MSKAPFSHNAGAGQLNALKSAGRRNVRRIVPFPTEEVVAAENPKEAKKQILAEKPDLILLDIMMDSIFDGYSLCHDIKTSQEFQELKDTPVIFVSAVKERSGSRFAFDTTQYGLMEPDDYIDKPVQPEDLFARIEKLLKKKPEKP